MRNGGLTTAEVAKRLRKMDGNFSAVARSFGVTRQAVHDYIKRHPDLHAVAAEAREAMKDEAESSLYSAVRDREAWAVCFFLKTQARDRGYVERQEVDQQVTTRLVIEEEIVSGDDPPQGAIAPGASRLPELPGQV